MLAPLGILIGYCVAFIYLHGLAEPWKLVGNPGEKVIDIIGVTEDLRAVFQSESGQVYSIKLPRNNESIGYIRWIKAGSDVQVSESFELIEPRFLPPPPLFRIIEVYTIEIPQIEAHEELKIAFSSDGNVWIWKYIIGGYSPILYYVFPILGFIIGLILAFFITLFRKLMIRGN